MATSSPDVSSLARFSNTVAAILTRLGDRNTKEQYSFLSLQLNSLTKIHGDASADLERAKGTLEEREKTVVTLLKQNKEIHTSQTLKPLNSYRSYADAARSRTLPKAHVLLVQPNESEVSSSDIMKNIKENLNPASKNIQVTRIRTTKSNAVIIGTSKESQLSRLEKFINKHISDVTVKPLKKLQPTLIVRNVPTDVTLERLQSCIYEQYADCIPETAPDNVETTEFVSARFAIGRRDAPSRDIVVRCAKEIWKNLLETGFIYADWSRCRIENYVLHKQCRKCGGFDHDAKDCNKSVICSHCGDAHLRKDCQKLSSPACCVTCKNETKKPHGTFNKACPAIDATIMRTDYGCELKTFEHYPDQLAAL